MSTAQATATLAAKFDPAAVEAEVFKVWTDEKCFAADPAAPAVKDVPGGGGKGEPYCIVIPPPNVTGALHLGHAINNTLQDMLIRVHRMKGFNTLWVPGVDHAGIATQAVVEKQLKEKENKTRHDVGRDGLVERIWAWKQEYGDRIVNQLQRMGCSCDWDRLRFTLDDMCAKAVRETFFKMFKDGKVFRGKRLVNWDTHLQTSISDDELYTETVKTNLWSIRYPVVSKEGEPPRHRGTEENAIEWVTIATTRPETMLADTAVAYHSSNPHAAFLRGKFVKLPLTGRLIPLIEDDVLVDPEFGTGFVKVTPAHDPNDYAVWQRHKGTPTEIDILNLMTPDGKVNDADPSWKAYIGLKLETAARKKVLEDLIAGGFHNPETDVKPHEANVNFSDRSKTAIQPYLSDQWFVRMAELAEPALEVVRNGTVRFFPERHSQQYLAWLGEKRDWPISRQLWWGHRIPVWTFTWAHEGGYEWSGKSFEAKEADRREWCIELQRFFDLAGLNDDLVVVRQSDSRFHHICARSDAGARLIAALIELFHRSHRIPRITTYGGRPSESVPHPQLIEQYPQEVRNAAYDQNWGGRIHWTRLVEDKVTDAQDPDVLDTWFSSGLWPHSTLGWPDQTSELAKWYPGSVLLTGRDIITLWVARMVMMGMYNMDGQIPFRHVAINPTILDGKGERMSKSKGNGVDPLDIIATHGADALRFTLATMATETQDVRLPVKKDAQGRNTSDKFDLGRNFCTKLWNAAKFVMSQVDSASREGAENAEKKELGLADKWILSRLDATLSDVETALSTYRFDAYAKAVYDFFWRDFCDWYLEASKPAMKDPARAKNTGEVLLAVLDASLRLLHPVIPHITEAIWWKLSEVKPDRSIPGVDLRPAKRLVLAPWPAVTTRDEAAEHVFPRIQDIISTIRNVRNEYKVEAKKVVTVSLAPPGAEAVAAVLANRELIELMGLCTLNKVETGLPAPENSAKAAINGCDVYLEGMVDPNAEANRIAKRKEELTKLIIMLEGRLASPNYTEKAPPKLVDQTRAQLSEARAELSKLG